MPPVHQPGHQALRRHRYNIPGGIYLITTTTHRRQRLFSDFSPARRMARQFARRDLCAGVELLAWVLMPDHVHWLVQLQGDTSLAQWTTRMKSGSARRFNQATGHQGPVWARAYHDHALRRNADIKACARYLVANPLRAGLAENIGDYPFWDAVWL
ncbi:REP-associated tyrosine transposase [Thiolapillus sp.]